MAVEFKDYYAALGLKKGASEKEIRSAFRKLARQYHPDVNPGNQEAEARFKELNEANEVLSDPEKRALYDQLGPQWREYEQYRSGGGDATPAEFLRATSGFAGAGSRAGAGGPRYEYRSTNADDLRDLFGDGDPFSDFFHQSFGRGGAGRTSASGAPVQMPGQDVEQQVDITLQEAIQGTTRVLQYADEAGPRRIEAKIPPGVREGARIRLSGQGAPGYNGGPNGDLYLVVRVAPHPLFEVKEADVHVDIPVELHVCLLGGEVTVPTPKGTRLALRIPAETQNGRVFRLNGQGLPPMRAGGKAGDLYAKAQVVLPTHLSEEERQLVARLAELRGVKEAVSHQ
jgi:curved DNA-binding protein